MLLSVVYAVVCRLLDLELIRQPAAHAQAVELLALRYEVRERRRLVPRPATAPVTDPVELARTYFRRWPAQENVIKDFLLPLGLDTNHGNAKTPVVNSEVAKRRAVLERRLANARPWAERARARSERAMYELDDAKDQVMRSAR